MTQHPCENHPRVAATHRRYSEAHSVKDPISGLVVEERYIYCCSPCAAKMKAIGIVMKKVD